MNSRPEDVSTLLEKLQLLEEDREFWMREANKNLTKYNDLLDETREFQMKEAKKEGILRPLPPSIVNPNTRVVRFPVGHTDPKDAIRHLVMALINLHHTCGYRDSVRVAIEMFSYLDDLHPLPMFDYDRKELKQLRDEMWKNGAYYAPQ